MQKAMVFGAGVSGLAAKKILEKLEYEVILVDDKIGVSSFEAEKMLDKISIFIKSPGIPYVDLVKKVQQKKIEVIDEIEISYRYLKKINANTKIIAVTGTNGKSTTTSKIAELINFFGMKSIACGNIGKAFAEVVLENKDLDYIVLELSSFQLENLKEFKADIAMIINLTPDHLDRYENRDEYYDVKFNIGKNQTLKDKFIINLDDSETMKRINKINSKIISISKNSISNSYLYCDEKNIIENDNKFIEIEKLSLKGKHNLENMLFVIATGKIIGIENETIKKFAYTAKSLEHRLETFLKVGKTIFINDSKGTNIDSTKFAVEAFKNSVLICGGKNKGFDLLPLAKLIKINVKEVYLIGENRKLFFEKLLEVNFFKEKIFDVENIENAIKLLKNKLDLEEENIVLLSPATSSYDQFKNFEDRGKKFKEIVLKYFGG
ncbi:MAG: UDP-N-acetylmuramoyl-L-alanine--D-glutamate ligase [Fusobacteriaceae bacterium]